MGAEKKRRAKLQKALRERAKRGRNVGKQANARVRTGKNRQQPNLRGVNHRPYTKQGC